MNKAKLVTETLILNNYVMFTIVQYITKNFLTLSLRVLTFNNYIEPIIR
jgi:hypothetical protein